MTLPRSDVVAAGGLVQLRTSLVTLASCGQFGRDLRVGPCVELSALRTHGDTRDTVEAGHANVPWLLAGPSLLIGYGIAEHLEITSVFGMGLPLTSRPRFTVAGAGDVAVADWVTLHLDLRLGGRW
ncbi:MAG: hypothetical protein QM778_30180 [Myxococcales bacterium]